MTTHAIVLFENSDLSDRRFGGETLAGRSLIALKKSGISEVVVLCPAGLRAAAEGAIEGVRASRLPQSVEIREMASSLDREISLVSSGWNGRFLLLATDSIHHPTLLEPMTQPTSAALAIHDGVSMTDAGPTFQSDFREKFKIIFRSRVQFTLVSVAAGMVGGTDHRYVSCGVLNVSSEELRSFSDFKSVNELADRMATAGRLRAQRVGQAWWLPIQASVDRETIRDFFWKVAFKEISGEFSKKVNSKLSRPLSLLLSDWQITPNAISITQIILFFASTSLLLLDHYFAMVAFAVMWQFAAGILDRCDGETARIRNYESEAGARFDMFVDDLRFYLPFCMLAISLALLNGQSFYGWSFVGIVGWGLGVTIIQQIWMRRMGYVSLQVMNRDYIKTFDDSSARAFDKWQPIFKGDIRTFYVTILSFFGSKELIFWVLGIYIFFVGVAGIVGMRRLAPRGRLNKITMPS